jgi:hypothetical protein
MNQEEILYTPPDISKKDIKNIDKSLDTIYELLYNLVDKDIKLHIEKKNIIEYKDGK